MGIAFAASKPNIVYALIEAKDNALYKSVDGGEKWTLVSKKDIGNRPFYYAEIYVDPNNENRIYNLWSYVSKSEDGGKTFKTIADYGNNIHPDHHAFWIDPDDSNYLIDGNDGGLNISRDGSKTWRFVQNLPVGQFYHVDIDNDFPYNVYGGMQDNGSWAGPGFVLRRGGISNHDWQEVMFGDGFDVAARRDDNRYGYAMSQGGNIGLWDRLTGRTEFIQPQHPEGEELRYNWNAALALDPFDDQSLYYGSQYVHHSQDGGRSWRIISDDLTTNDTTKQDQSKSGVLTLDVTGAENHTSILCIEPSPHDKDVIWVGTDDGRLQLTRDGGKTWSELSAKLSGLAKNAWIPQINLSKTNDKEIFVVANNYRMNDWSAWLYHSLDGGLSWKRIVDDSDVGGFVCSMVQDPKQENLLFLGTDVGLYFSLDRGAQWHKWPKGLPSVQIRDMKIQEDFNDLVLGTFGRSFWILDDIEPLRTLAREGVQNLENDLKVFKPGTAYLTATKSYQGVRFIGQGEFVGSNKPQGALLTLWKKPKDDKKAHGKKDMNDHDEAKGKGKKSKKKKDKVKIRVLDSQNDTIRTFKRKIKDGFNRIGWRPDSKGVDFPKQEEPKEKQEPGGMPILPGDYKLVFEYKGQKDSTMLTIASDPRIDGDLIDTPAKYEAMKAYNNKIEKVTQAYNNLKEAKKSMDLYDKIIEVQVDSTQKELKQLQKDTRGQIDSLMNLIILTKSDKVEYRDNSKTLNRQLWRARMFLGASLGEPSENGLNAVKNTERKISGVLTAVNGFFEDDWSAYLTKIKGLPLDIFKEYESIRIE